MTEQEIYKLQSFVRECQDLYSVIRESDYAKMNLLQDNENIIRGLRLNFLQSAYTTEEIDGLLQPLTTEIERLCDSVKEKAADKLRKMEMPKEVQP